MDFFYAFDDDDGSVFQLSTPILFSIATVRFHHPDSRIIVRDLGSHDWGEFPDRMGFEVIPGVSELERTIPRTEKKDRRIIGRNHIDEMNIRQSSTFVECLNLLSQFDERVTGISHNIMLLRPIDRFESEGVHLRWSNVSLYHFHRDDILAMRFLETQAAFAHLSAHCSETRKRIARSAQRRVVDDQAISHYVMSSGLVDGCWKEIPEECNCTKHEISRVKNIKRINLCGLGPNRKRCVVLVKEIFTMVREFFTRDELISSFGNYAFNRGIISCDDLIGKSKDDLLERMLK